MGFNELTEREKVVCAKAYDKYIQQANEEDKYFEGWKPVCLDEFADNEWKEVCDLERIYENVCDEFYNTKDCECTYDIVGSPYAKVVHINYQNEAFVYTSFEELYRAEVQYEIKDDYFDIGFKGIKDYLDEEAFEFVCKDNGWDYETTAKEFEKFESEECNKCDKKLECEIDGWYCDVMYELNERLRVL